jgi:hypothetical protein
MARKSEVYTWRVAASTKARLEEAAREANRSVAQLLDEIVAHHLEARGSISKSEADEQRRLHTQAARYRGCISSGVANRSARTRELVRARLKRRRARVH